MTFPAITRNIRVGVIRPSRVAAVAVFLFLAGTSSRVEASCGDWLAGHEGSMPGPAAAQDDHRPAAPAPCDGPGCRRSRDHLPAVPPSPTRQLDNTERWCRLVEELASRAPLSTLLEPDAESFPLTGFRPSIERPPRV